MKSLKKGFTLVELMVVIVIIGILAALAIPRFLGATNKTKATEFKPVLKQIFTLEEAFRQESPTGNYGTLEAAGWDIPSGPEPYFGYGLGATAVIDAATQTAAMTAAVPAALIAAAAANPMTPEKLASSTPRTLTGMRIKASVATNPNLAVGDQGCVSTTGNILATTATLASLTGATALLATTPGTCQP